MVLWDQTVICKSVEGLRCLIFGESSFTSEGFWGRRRGTCSVLFIPFLAISGSNALERNYQEVLRGFAVFGIRPWGSSWEGTSYLSWPSKW